jgi:hypothetical protein
MINGITGKEETIESVAIGMYNALRYSNMRDVPEINRREIVSHEISRFEEFKKEYNNRVNK